MGATHDIGVTPRPIYKSDGRKLPDCYTQPLELRDELTRELGAFPLFQFWGPGTSIVSSRWIADAALHVRRTRSPTLTLVYLPHLDYDLQRFGPDDPRVAKSLAEIDAVAGDLIADAERDGARVIVLSEYGISPVSTPIHINRALREAGLLSVRVEDGGELLDVPQSRAFAVADHQIAHIYVAESGLIGEVKRIVAALPGVEHVLDRSEQSCVRARSSALGRARRAGATRMPGSPTTTGSTTAGRRISRASSRSIASPATTRWSSFSIRRSVRPSSRSAGASHAAHSDFAR